MNLCASKKTSLAAARVTLQAIRDSADAFPPLKSTAAAIIIVWEAIEVSILSPLFHVTYYTYDTFGILEGEIKQEGLQEACTASHGHCERYLAANEGLWGQFTGGGSTEYRRDREVGHVA